MYLPIGFIIFLSFAAAQIKANPSDGEEPEWNDNYISQANNLLLARTDSINFMDNLKVAEEMIEESGTSTSHASLPREVHQIIESFVSLRPIAVAMFLQEELTLQCTETEYQPLSEMIDLILTHSGEPRHIEFESHKRLIILVGDMREEYFNYCFRKLGDRIVRFGAETAVGNMTLELMNNLMPLTSKRTMDGIYILPGTQIPYDLSRTETLSSMGDYELWYKCLKSVNHILDPQTEFSREFSIDRSIGKGGLVYKEKAMRLLQLLLDRTCDQIDRREKLREAFKKAIDLCIRLRIQSIDVRFLRVVSDSLLSYQLCKIAKKIDIERFGRLMSQSPIWVLD